MSEIDDIAKQIDFNNLSYYFTSPNLALINFISFRGPMHIYNEINNGNISTEKIEEDQKEFESNLNKITREKSSSNKNNRKYK